MALTSIIITTHNRPALLRRAVESARNAGSDIEVVVVDDGSMDETRDVCASLDGIVVVRLEEQRGVGSARAAGIAASSGTYVSFLDDDDVRLPGTIDRQVRLLEESPRAALVYGQIFRGSQTLVVTGRIFPRHCPMGDVFWLLMRMNFIPSIAAVVRRSAIDEVGGIHSGSAPADDWDLWLRLSEFHQVLALEEPVAIYREPTLWSEQGSSRLVDALLPAGLRVLERCASLSRVRADPRAFRRATRGVKRLLCRRLLAETLQAARAGDPYAFVSFSRAVVTSPGALVHAVFSPDTWKKVRTIIAEDEERAG